MGRENSSGNVDVVIGGASACIRHCILERDGSSPATSVEMPGGGPGTAAGRDYSGVVWVTDTSKNGTFVRHADQMIPLRKGVRTAIQLPPQRSKSEVVRV